MWRVTTKQDTSDLIRSLLHSSHALTSCPGNSVHHCVCVCVCVRGPANPQSENYVSSERISSPRFSQGPFGWIRRSCSRVFHPIHKQTAHQKPEMVSNKDTDGETRAGAEIDLVMNTETVNLQVLTQLKCEKDWAKGETSLTL